MVWWEDKERIALLAKIDEPYASASSRQDVQNIELHALDTAYTELPGQTKPNSTLSR